MYKIGHCWCGHSAYETADVFVALQEGERVTWVRGRFPTCRLHRSAVSWPSDQRRSAVLRVLASWENLSFDAKLSAANDLQLLGEDPDRTVYEILG